MKKSVKRVGLVVGTVAVLFVLFAGTWIYRAMADMRAMVPAGTGAIVDGVYAVKDSYVNLYVVRGATGAVAFDSGSDPENVRKGLESLSIEPGDVAAVFLTHGDSDHTGGLPVFRSAAVYLPSEEEQMVDGRTARFVVFKNTLSREHRPLGDGQTVDIDGLKVTAVLTPGHTPGSTCYLVDGRYLFTGDTMSLRSGRADVFSRAINMDSAVQRVSLERLSRLEGIEYLFTAHHGYSGSARTALEAFRK